MSNLTIGTVAFSNLTEHEIYNGKTTGKYSIVVTLSNSEAAKLEAEGVKLKMYQPKDEDGNPAGEAISQRKFASQYPVKVVGLDNQPVKGELGHGSGVRIAWKGGQHPEPGAIPYVTEVRVVGQVEPEGELPSEF